MLIHCSMTGSLPWYWIASENLWVSTESGLDRWQPERRAFLHVRHTGGDSHSLSGTQISQVIEDPTARCGSAP